MEFLTPSRLPATHTRATPLDPHSSRPQVRLHIAHSSRRDTGHVRARGDNGALGTCSAAQVACRPAPHRPAARLCLTRCRAKRSPTSAHRQPSAWRNGSVHPLTPASAAFTGASEAKGSPEPGSKFATNARSQHRTTSSHDKDSSRPVGDHRLEIPPAQNTGTRRACGCPRGGGASSRHRVAQPV